MRAGKRVIHLALSLTRANNARDYLVSIGVSAGRITVRNFGDTCPHANGAPALNRRVEFYKDAARRVAAARARL